MTSLYVALGGAAGSLARFALAGWIAGRTAGGFPWATLAVNLSGCILLGVVIRMVPLQTAELRALLAVGFCGAFTTFSTFGYETLVLLQRGAHAEAAAYVLGSVVLGTAGVALGMAAAAVLG